jgi:cobalamin biosynthesis protein CbiD
LEGAREAGGTKTCTGAIAKQRTAAPQGAASLSLAVLESDGRKREVAIDNSARWHHLGRGKVKKTPSKRK